MNFLKSKKADSQSILTKLFTLPDIDEIIRQYQLKEVSSPEIFYGSSYRFHPEGLFSEEVFGLEGSKERRVMFGYIDLHGEYIHPEIYDLIKKSNKKLYEGIIKKHFKFEVDEKSGKIKLIEDQSGYTGIEFFKKVIENKDVLIDLNPRVKALIDKYYDKNLSRILIRKVLVIPPLYRPIIYVNGRPMPDPLNDIYSKIIFHAQKTSDSGLFGVDLNFPLVQESVWNLFASLKENFAGKSGLIRGFTLGKRLDFTARAVITPDPTLDLNTLGVPYKILARIAEPFVIHVLMTGYLEDGSYIPEVLSEKFRIPPSKTALSLLLKKYAKGMISDEFLNKLVEEAIELAVKDKYILMKRDPSLHRGSWHAMRIKPVNDLCIHFPPGWTGPMNADFDGDSVANATVTLFVKDGDTMQTITADISKFA